jgi:hypothetical protein
MDATKDSILADDCVKGTSGVEPGVGAGMDSWLGVDAVDANRANGRDVKLLLPSMGLYNDKKSLKR